MVAVRHRGFAGAGWVTGPAAWAISTQFNYAIVDWVCASGWRVVPWTTLVLILLSLFGAAISALNWRRNPDIQTNSPVAGAPHQFLAITGMLSGLLFALVIAMQGTAGFILTGCE